MVIDEPAFEGRGVGEILLFRIDVRRIDELLHEAQRVGRRCTRSARNECQLFRSLLTP
jgi:hypothetical protein